MDTKKSVSMGTIFGVVAVWFGAHAGGGFASGNQNMNFFVQYGWPAIFTPIIAMVILALVYRVIVIMCNQHKVSNYNDWSHKLYAPYDKVLSPVYGICNVGASLLATSASVAGAAAVLNEVFNFNYMVCVVIIAICTILLSMFGAGLISKASSIFVIVIMASVIIISIAGLAKNGGNIAVEIANSYAPKGVGNAIWKSVTYASFQIFSLMGTFGVAMQLKTEKACNKAAVLGFIINVSMLELNTLVCIAYRETITGNTLPIFTIAKSLDIPALTILYTLGLFCAFLSTAVSVVFGLIARFGKYNTKFNLSNNVWNCIVGVLCIAVAMFAASFGLTKIVAIGYGYLGVIGIFLVAVPCLVAGTIKIRKHRAETIEG